MRHDQLLRKHRVDRARAGMTLIEILAVMVILSILMVILVPKVAGMVGAAERKIAVSQLRQLDIAISEYEHEFGDYPKSRFHADWGPAPNEINLGIECLVLQLWGKEWSGTNLSYDLLSNVDGDVSKVQVARDMGKELSELMDPWDNPIAYFHRKDYGRTDVYTTIDPESGEPLESSVTAIKNPRSKVFANPRSYQLISAGEDGTFGTEDDVVNFKLR